MSPLKLILIVGGILVLVIGIIYARFLVLKNRKNAGVQRTWRLDPPEPLSEPLSGSRLSTYDSEEGMEPTVEVLHAPMKFPRADFRRAFILKTLMDEPRWRIPPHSDLPQ